MKEESVKNSIKFMKLELFFSDFFKFFQLFVVLKKNIALTRLSLMSATSRVTSLPEVNTITTMS